VKAHYIFADGSSRSRESSPAGEAQGVAYHEQVNCARELRAWPLVEVPKVIGEKGVRIRDIMAQVGGGDAAAAGGIGTLLLLNLFRNQMNLRRQTAIRSEVERGLLFRLRRESAYSVPSGRFLTADYC